jgi:hypothetical protein
MPFAVTKNERFMLAALASLLALALLVVLL